MKRLLGVAGGLLLIVSLSSAQLTSGSYTVGGGGSPDYATLTAAFAALSSGVTGPVEFVIMGDLTEAGDVAVPSGAGLNSTDTLGIRVGTSVTATITLTSSSSIRTGGQDYITIDGSNSSSTDQSLTIKHSGTSAGNSAIWIEGLSDNITVKNCKLGDATNTPDFAIKTSGASGNKINNVSIQNNTIHGIGDLNGIIYLKYVEGTSDISGNVITGDQAGSTQAIGIKLENCAGTTTIQKNRLHVLNSAGAFGLFGIQEYSASGGTLKIYNNFIGGGFVSSSSSDYYLIDLRGGAAKEIFHNTLVINSVAGSPFNSAGLYIENGTAKFINNIVINNYDPGALYPSACIWNNFAGVFGDPLDLFSDFNNLYRTGTNNYIGNDGISTYSTLANWHSQTGLGTPDGRSSNASVNFVNPASDFLLSTGSNGNDSLRGTDSLLTLVADDIEGNTRLSNPQGPYMGADEGSINLPVQLTAITATSNRLDAVLRWSTATEVNNHGFEVERRSVLAGGQGSGGGVTSSPWEKVGFISGSGTSSSPKEYSYVDAGLPAGRYAYRIKQIDNDGSFTYYLAAEVEVGATEKVLALESNYPNPFNPSTNIAFSVPENGKVALKVFNIIGQEVAVLFDGIAEAGKLYQQAFNASQLPTGLYFSRLEFGGKSLMRKMLFVK